MISEQSCDTEDSSNNCWKYSFAMTEIIVFKLDLKYIQNYISNCNNISEYHWFYYISDQINAVLVSLRGFK